MKKRTWKSDKALEKIANELEAIKELLKMLVDILSK